MKDCNFVKKRLQHKCFPVKLSKFLRTLILMNICKRLLLQSDFIVFRIHHESISLPLTFEKLWLFQVIFNLMNFPLIITHRKLLSKAKLKLFLKLFPKIKSNSIYGLYIEAITAERNFSVELSSWVWSFSFKTWHKHFEKVTNIIEKIITFLTNPT